MQSALSADDPHETCESVWNGWRGHQELIGWSLQLLVKQTEAIPFFLHCWWTWYDHSPSLLMFSSRNCVESFISVWFKKWGGHCLSDFIPVGKSLKHADFQSHVFSNWAGEMKRSRKQLWCQSEEYYKYQLTQKMFAVKQLKVQTLEAHWWDPKYMDLTAQIDSDRLQHYHFKNNAQDADLLDRWWHLVLLAMRYLIAEHCTMEVAPLSLPSTLRSLRGVLPCAMSILWCNRGRKAAWARWCCELFGKFHLCVRHHGWITSSGRTAANTIPSSERLPFYPDGKWKAAY